MRHTYEFHETDLETRCQFTHFKSLFPITRHLESPIQNTAFLKPRDLAIGN